MFHHSRETICGRWIQNSHGEWVVHRDHERSHKNDDFALFFPFVFRCGWTSLLWRFFIHSFCCCCCWFFKSLRDREIVSSAHKKMRDWLTEQSFIWYFMNWIFSDSESNLLETVLPILWTGCILRRIGFVRTYWAIFIWLLFWINNDYRSHFGTSECAWFGTSIDVIKFHNNNKSHSHRNLSEMQSQIGVECIYLLVT